MARRFEQAILAGEVAVIGPGAVGSITFAAPGPDSRENKKGNKSGKIEFRAIGTAKLLSNTAAVVVMIGSECVVLANIPAPLEPNETVEAVTRNSMNTFLEVCYRTISPVAPRSYVIVDAIGPRNRAWKLPDRVSLIRRMLSDAQPGAVPSEAGYVYHRVAPDVPFGHVFVDARVHPPKLYVNDVEKIRVSGLLIAEAK
ncbi:hypothetical protein ASPACDRAFT_60208 [Aspergillus aculeatus ATCC 16872]|uniref:Uncharacterized protein n=1 Tax=Aspergillus aculeatus (strain ATCC 16872 / CBS 172.66 / WB 5094) TaxID=690307 RepID=A0A1L9WVX0_ASPA1|nr:uncharacterized protein ASPACDRAFT_60208 [Aspergillus aculeatus ATCC 16872]OJK00372.1 hypothetical protein ASPACDRAFT_60208 [Aspergillus aculeatus ATCC 16872]